MASDLWRKSTYPWRDYPIVNVQPLNCGYTWIVQTLTKMQPDLSASCWRSKCAHALAPHREVSHARSKLSRGTQLKCHPLFGKVLIHKIHSFLRPYQAVFFHVCEWTSPNLPSHHNSFINSCPWGTDPWWATLHTRRRNQMTCSSLKGNLVSVSPWWTGVIHLPCRPSVLGVTRTCSSLA